jgi:hypothetical protein
MKKALVLVLLLACFSFAENGTWAHLNIKWKAPMGWESHYYTDYASVGDSPGLMVYSLRFRKKVHPLFKIGFNYSQFHKYLEAPMHRFELAGFYSQSFDMLSIAHRSRLERRYAELTDKFDYRYRAAFYVNYKLPYGIKVGVANEFLFYAQFEEWMPYGEWNLLQNRLDPIKINYSINESNTLGLYYRIKTSGGDLAKRHDYIGLSYSVSL